MHALVVDDDYFVVTALEAKIDWASLGVEKVHTAHNVAQARDILMKHPIRILISDIEMPQGSGLELLAWIREERYNVQAILLTNYADFNYAQKAIELNSFEYFLKPIQFDKLMLIIRKAVERAREQQRQEQAIREGYYWQRNQAKILEHFWRKLIHDSASCGLKPGQVARAVEEQNLSYGMDDLVHPLLINLFPYDGSMGAEEKNLFDFALLNVAYELFRHPGYTVETILEYSAHNWIAVLRWSRSPDTLTIEKLCGSFIQQANHSLKCDACCTVGMPSRLDTVSEAFRQLLQLSAGMAKRRNQVFLAERGPGRADEAYIPPDLAALESHLDNNRPDAFLRETTTYLNRYSNDNHVATSALALFRLDIMQLVYAFLKSQGIQAHQLYQGKPNERLLAHSLNSIEDMEAYVQYLVQTAMSYRDFAGQSKTVAEEIKHYIHSHYGEDLTRLSLADVFYLHPDYLARLFKKETGVSLGAYIIGARIEAAKKLLRTTPLSVFAVANKVGYANYSYFAKVFKQETGMSPNEYKHA
ncbi:response regulator transcription factor [Cohnella fermenti]|uniref:Response regulator n=1 Tax=Cohnella fermenti TaxID=2565925 RepID=A0A4S4BYR8_9BACL|nr:helix-turn-helix domain-containing protein [Cohnella fermenti]THF80388.1 response regulator [Cohnella fermenti]